MRKNLVLGQNREDRHEPECQRSAPRPLLNSVQGKNLENLQFSSADAEELEIQRSAPHPLLEYRVLDENLVDLHHLHPELEELECPWSAR